MFKLPGKKILLLSIAFAEAVFIVSTDAFYLSLLQQPTPISISTIFFCFACLIGLNLLLLVAFLRSQHLLSIYTRIVAILWIGISIWYWGFGALYYFSTINLNAQQIKWAGFSFLWEVPILGIMLIFLCLYIFYRIYHPFELKTQQNIEKTYMRLLRYPLYVSLLLSLFTVLGYTIGALEVHFFATLPMIETVKNIANGFVISIFLAFFFYLIIDIVTSDLRGRIKEEYKFTSLYPRKLPKRILFLSSVLSLGIISVIGLFVFQLSQVLILQSVYTQLQRDMTAASSAVYGPQVFKTLSISPHTKVFLVASADIEEQGFAEDTITRIYAGDSGVIFDNNGTGKLVAFGVYPAIGQKIVASVPVSDFYSPLLAITIAVVSLGLFVIIFTLVLALFFTDILSKTVKNLTESIKSAANTDMIPKIEMNTEDELEELSYVFMLFVDKLRTAVRATQVEREHVEDEKAKLETLLQELPIGVEVLDADTGNVRLMNKAALDLLGGKIDITKPGNILREEYKMVKEDGTEYPNAENPITIAIKENKLTSKSNIFLHQATGTTMALKVICAPVKDSAGKTTAFVVLIQDVNKEYQLDKEKSKFVYFTTHELRTPMTAIKGIVSMILSNDYGEIPLDARSALEDVLQSTNSLLDIVNDDLNLSRIESGTVKLDYSDFSLKDVLQHLLDELGPLAKEKNLTFVLQAPENVLIHSDEGRVREIIGNLLGNALKFTQNGSITATLGYSGGFARVAINDTGPGISEENKEKLFKKFGKLSSGDFPGGNSGMGFGLYISKEFAKLLGGDVYLEESTPDKGSTFVLELPLSASVVM